MPTPDGRLGRLALDWGLPAFVALSAVFLYLNGALFSPLSALHIDFSINFTAANAIRDHIDPYGDATLLQRAQQLHSPTRLIYKSLFTSYIQPPTSALAIVPLTILPWREASRAYLVLNNVLLIAAVGLTLYAVRPSLPWRWALAGAAIVLMGFSQIYESLALGQVDASVALLLAIGYWGYTRKRPAVTGTAIALGAAIKIVPGLLLLYFLLKREYRVVAWGIACGLALLLLSAAVAGADTYRTYVTEVLPALSKSSPYYANVSIPAAIVRAFIHGPVNGLAPISSLEETRAIAAARAWSLLAELGLVVVTAILLWRSAAGRRAAERPVPDTPSIVEYYLVIAVGLLISPVSWESYLVWLLPLFVAVFLAPDRVLPGQRRLRLAALAALAIAYLALNYPGDLYPFDVNFVFYHPTWVPGVWVEDRMQIYHHHLNVVPVIRLYALLFFTGALGCVLVWQRRAAPLARAAQAAAVQPDPEPA